MVQLVCLPSPAIRNAQLMSSQSRYKNTRVKGFLCTFIVGPFCILTIDTWAGILELVRPHRLVSVGPCRWRYHIPRLDGY